MEAFYLADLDFWLLVFRMMTLKGLHFAGVGLDIFEFGFICVLLSIQSYVCHCDMFGSCDLM